MLRTGKDLEDIYQRHVDMLYRVAYSFMKNGADAEDMVQETFLRLMRSGTVFESAQHEKAWLIVTVSNLCKSALRSPWRRREDFDALSDQPTTEDAAPDETLQAVLALPDDYKLPVYLYYYEGFTMRTLIPSVSQYAAKYLLRNDFPSPLFTLIILMTVERCGCR